MVRAWGCDDRILLQGPIGTLGYPPPKLDSFYGIRWDAYIDPVVHFLHWFRFPCMVYLAHSRKPKKWSGHGVAMIGFSCRGP